MGMLNVADAQILLAQVDARYMEQFRNLQDGSWAMKILHTLPMSKSKTRLPWIKVFSGFREWNTMDKRFQNVQVDDFAAETRPLETSFKIDRRNSLPQILEQIVDLTDGLAEAVAFFDDDLTARAMLDGETGGASYPGFKFYDGLASFSESHPVDPDDTQAGAPVWPNLHKGKPLSLESLEYGIHAMARVRAPNGRNMRVFPTHLIHPGTLSQTAKRLLKTGIIGRLLAQANNAAAGAGETNIHSDGDIIPVNAHELTYGFPKEQINGSEDDWYLVCRTPTRKPLTKLELQAPVDMPLNGQIDGTKAEVHYGKEASASVVITQSWFIHKFKKAA